MPAVSSKQTALQSLAPRLLDLEQSLAALHAPGLAAAVSRYRADSAAARFHLHLHGGPAIVAILGGTGTGKSTLLNRLLNANVSAASFRRTFTAGAVAVVDLSHPLPAGWLGVEAHILPAADLPARGQLDQLMVVPLENELLKHVALIDTPDLDGDQPAHHAQADRAFRWAQAVVFLVTPEKYQMTELPPYYRLAMRYGIPALFVMNKAESRDVLDDYTTQLLQSHGFDDPRVFCIARDDATFPSPSDQDLDALKQALQLLQNKQTTQAGGFSPGSDRAKSTGIHQRLQDLLARAKDQIIQPLLDARSQSDGIIESLRSMTTPQPNVDVNPITQQLQRRLQQKSVLYLMGPQRIFDRVRQVPLMLAKLPRNTWDLFRTGKLRTRVNHEPLPDDWQETGPNFQSALADQMKLLHARMDDIVRSSPAAERWIAGDAAGYQAVKINPADAGKIAEDELAELKKWLEQRWNAVPRDTRMLQSLLKVIPGGRKLAQMSEAAPYLLAIVVASHHAVFGGVDLLILGGYSLATWLTEKLSNEVASRARTTNERIAAQYTQLAQRQIEAMIIWIDRQSPPLAELQRLVHVVDDLYGSVEKTD